MDRVSFRVIYKRLTSLLITLTTIVPCVSSPHRPLSLPLTTSYCGLVLEILVRSKWVRPKKNFVTVMSFSLVVPVSCLQIGSYRGNPVEVYKCVVTL